MASKTWKAVELKIARYLGGQRRGADFVERDRSGIGKDDVIGIPGWAIEIKHDKAANVSLALQALDQVDTVYGVVKANAVPVAVVHKGGLNIIEKSVVCFRPETLQPLLAELTGVHVRTICYQAKRPLWGGVVQAATAKGDHRSITVAHVVRLTLRAEFMALSLPVLKDFLLPLRS